MTPALTARVPQGAELPAIGLGTPGLVDGQSGVTRPAADTGRAEARIKALVEEHLRLRALVANRSKVGALAELLQGAGRGVSDLISISIGSGMAAGIVHERRLYMGANSSAGELGHVTVHPDGPPCPCGNRGCLQQFASGPALADLARARLREGGAGILRTLLGDHLERINAHTVLRAALEGDPLARSVADEAARSLGIAIANLINLFNPELIVLGGPVGRSAQALLEPLQEEVRRRAQAIPLSAARIVTSELGSEAGAAGAAARVLQQASELIFARAT